MDECNLLKKYYELYREQCNISKDLKKIYKKGRKPNFPEYVSEFLARKICRATKAKKGDITINNLQIEVKCFASTGPISFGPTENWNIIIFIDAIDTEKIILIIYKISNTEKIILIIYKISNTEKIWSEIKVNKTETFSQKCNSGQRPRICFSELCKQLPMPDYVIEYGNINNIFENNFPKIEIEI